MTKISMVSPPSKRMDLRLVPAVLVTWPVALAGAFIDAAWSAAVAGILASAAGLLLVGPRRHRPAPHRARTIPATIALACIMGAAVAVHCAVMTNTREEGPLAEAVAEGSGVLIQVLITGAPTEVRVPGQSNGNKWSMAATLVEVTSKGSVIRGSADLMVMGGNGWQDVRPGQRVRTSGTLKAVREGQTQAALLSASSTPVLVASTFDLRQSSAEVRRHFIAASSWLPPDPAGLMPGMVTGDTSALPESLEADMKTTGMTHLTAVSGANCSLVLGGFILLARCLRLTRPIAGVFAACGLMAFVVMVGPDPSVLRAAVMGAVGLAALIGGLRGRSLTFLCLATIVLLLLDPGIAANVGFLLSALATLGIVLLATRVASWIPVWVPRWLAAGVAVPLSAQLLCGPVIVALQPQFTPYALIANVVASILVAPVTIFGTLAVPLSVGLPWLAAVPIALAGACAGVVAGVARFFAQLPGAALPWAEGPVGIVSMVAFSMMTLLVVWAALHLAQAMAGIVGLHDAVVILLDRWLGKRTGGRASSKET